MPKGLNNNGARLLRIDRLFSKNGRMPGGAGRRTSTSFGAINASSATGIPNLVR